jgi:hypothetical protein
LLEDYPELQQEETVQQMRSDAQRWAQDLGNPRLVSEPAFLELVLLAGKTTARAEGETPAGGGEPGQQQQQQQGQVALEQGGGAPGASAQPDDRVQQIKNAGKRAQPGADFWM